MAYISPQRHLHESEDLLPQVTRSIGRNYKRAMSAEFTAGELLTAEYLLPTSHRHLHESEDLPPQVTRSIGRNYKRALKRAMNAEFTVEELLAAEDLLFQGDDEVVGISSTSDSLNWS